MSFSLNNIITRLKARLSKMCKTRMGLSGNILLMLVLGLALWATTPVATKGASECIKDVKSILCNIPIPCAEEPNPNSIDFLHYLSDTSYKTFVKLDLNDPLNGFESLNTTIPTVLVAHGAFSSPYDAMGQQIRQGFADLNNKTKLAYNLIFIDWEDLSKPCGCLSTCYLYYENARRNIVVVGEQTAFLLNTMVQFEKTSWNQTIYIGHSLATHIPNFIKPHLENGTFRQLHALDPAGVCYEEEPDDKKLDPSDADFVSVIHTDTCLGTKDPIGHADFYPNGGLAPQPGCENEEERNTRRCSHSRGYHFFAESISNSVAFPALRCGSWEHYLDGDCNENEVNYMGWNSKYPGAVHVKYYLEAYLSRIPNTTTSTTSTPSSQSAVWCFTNKNLLLRTAYVLFFYNSIWFYYMTLG